MINESAVSADSTEDAAEASTPDSSTLKRGDKRSITPAERWVLICDNVYERAQKRGFVGGNPLQDLAEASQEIHAGYETDFNCVFSLTSSEEITELSKRLHEEFGISTIREMAADKHAEWARAVVRLADATPAAETLADSRIAEARDFGASQASLLKREFGSETVRDLGANPLFNAAQAIVMLAESEG